MRTRRLLSAFLGGLVTISAMAQNDKHDDYDLSVKIDQIVVTGTGTHQRLKNTPAPVSVITSNEIKKAGITDFQQAMTMLVPSLSFSSNSMGAFLMMNGLSNKYVLVLVNGRKLFGDVGNNVDLSRIDMSTVKRIEVLNGAGSSLYGSDAIAGVVNIITNQPKNVAQVVSSSRYEGYGQYTQNVNANIASEKFGSYTSFRHQQSDSWQSNELGFDKDRASGIISLVPTVGQMFTGYHSNNVNQKFTFNPNRKLSIEANGGYYWKLTDRPVTKRGTEGSSDYDMHYESYNAGLRGRYKFNKNTSVMLDLVNDNYIQNYRYLREPSKGNYKPGDYNRIKLQRFYQAQAKGIFKFYDNSQTVMGLDYRRETLNRPSGHVNKGVYTMSGYLQHEMTFSKRFKAIAGGRYDYHETAGGRLSPKLALMYTEGPFKARVNYSAGYRAPGLNELYYLLPRRTSLSYGNKNLKPENSNYASLNLEYSNNFFNLSVTGYINSINDMISTVYTPFDELSDEVAARIIQEAKDANIPEDDINKFPKMNLRSYTNADEGLVKGVEVSTMLQVGYGFSVSGNYTYASAKNKIDGEWDNVVRSIRHTGTVAANYVHDWKDYRLNINLNGRFQSKRFHPGHSYGDAPGYGVWNLNTKHSFYGFNHLGMDLGLGVNNILDRVDRRPYGSNYSLFSPGRTAYISLTLKFNK